MKKLLYLMVVLVLIMNAASPGANIYVNAAATGSGTGVDWANAYTDLTSALPAVSGDVIYVAEGVYSPGSLVTSSFTPASGVTLMGGYSKDDPAAMPRDPMIYTTILSGDVNGDDIIYDLANNSDPSLITTSLANERLDNNNCILTVTADYTDITIDGFFFIGGARKDGSASRGGGALWLRDGNTNTTIRNCQFLHNFSGTGGGGGGAIFGRAPVNALIEDCYFFGNAADNCKGGAMEFYGYPRNGTLNLVIRRCTFKNNINTQNYYASAISLNLKFTATITDCLFVENGGNTSTMVIYAKSGAASNATPIDQSLVMTNCVFAGNTSFNRGCLYLYHDDAAQGPFSWATCSVSNCLFINNESGITNVLGTGNGRGTAIWMVNDSTANPWNPVIQNCTIANNQDVSGGHPAIWLSSNLVPAVNPTTLTIKNNIIWGNKGLLGSPSFGGWDTSQPGTCIVNYNCISTTDPNDYLPAGSVGNMMADPLFVNPSIGDYHLRSASPCIDKGDPASAYANEPKWLNGCRVNMGAYGNTAEAATTATCVALSADITGDCKVNTADLLQLRTQWLKTCP